MKKMLQNTLLLFAVLLINASLMAQGQVLPLNFEDVGVTHEIFGFGAADFGAIPAEIIDNPDATGENTSTKVGTITKPEGAQTWAGASLPLSAVIDLSNGPMFTIKVWSPRSGVPIMLKFEDRTSPPDNNGNPSIISEVMVSTTASMAWETLTYDMSTHAGYAASNNYDQVVVFPDFGNPGVAGDETYYFDDIMNLVTNSLNQTDLQAVKLNAFPNPASENLTVSFDIPTAGVVTMEVISILGQTVNQIDLGQVSEGSYNHSIDVNSLANGSYFLGLNLDGQRLRTQTIMVK